MVCGGKKVEGVGKKVVFPGLFFPWIGMPVWFRYCSGG